MLSGLVSKKMYHDMSDNKPKSKIRGQIDENLKRIYDETLHEQIPDKLTLLLEQLRRKVLPDTSPDTGPNASSDMFLNTGPGTHNDDGGVSR